MAAEDGQLDVGVNPGASEAEPLVAPPAAPIFDEPSLEQLLADEPYCFSFFAALRVFAQISARTAPSQEEPRSAIDKIRFRAHQSLSFPPSELWQVTRPAGGNPIADLTVTFLGLTGSMGALPRPYTELVMQRIRKGDFALRDFLDIFNHRLIQIFARAGEKYRFYLNHEVATIHEQARRAHGEQKLRAFFLDERPRLDLFSQILMDLSGVGTSLLRYRDSQRARLVPRHEIADSVIRFFCGQLSQTHRCAVSLARMIASYFEAPAEIIPFIGQWIQLPVEHQTCLRPSRPGAAPAPGMSSAPNARLRPQECPQRRISARIRVWAGMPSSVHACLRCRDAFGSASGRSRSINFAIFCRSAKNFGNWPISFGSTPGRRLILTSNQCSMALKCPGVSWGRKILVLRASAGTPGCATATLTNPSMTPSSAYLTPSL
jgi:type VI secretion system ImpH/TssG family protein